uniref:Uncharacterized protein n=1 Tax=Lepeophtheirus salmonis TaxID=72036 RepID=A0A0K2UPX1_LEPSM
MMDYSYRKVKWIDKIYWTIIWLIAIRMVRGNSMRRTLLLPGIMIVRQSMSIYFAITLNSFVISVLEQMNKRRNKVD